MSTSAEAGRPSRIARSSGQRQAIAAAMKMIAYAMSAPQITGCSVLSFAKNGVCSLLMNFVAPSAPFLAEFRGHAVAHLRPVLEFAEADPTMCRRGVFRLACGHREQALGRRRARVLGFAEITDVSSGVTMV